MKLQVAEILLTLYSRFLDWAAHCIDCGTFYFLGFIINSKYTYSSAKLAKIGSYFLRAKETNNIMILHGGEENKLIANQHERSPIAMRFFCMLDW